jgi:hypothetical protein
MVNFWSTSQRKEAQTPAKRPPREAAWLSGARKDRKALQHFAPKSHLNACHYPRRSSLRSLCEFVYHYATTLDADLAETEDAQAQESVTSTRLLQDLSRFEFR